jgi:hypothetical protein
VSESTFNTRCAAQALIENFKAAISDLFEEQRHCFDYTEHALLRDAIGKLKALEDSLEEPL